MGPIGWILVSMGIAMCVAMVFFIVYYYTNSRQEEIERPKYKMLEDDDE